MQVLVDSSLGVDEGILTTPRAPLQGGIHPAVSYYPSVTGTNTQVVRGNQYVQCFTDNPGSQLGGKRVTFDQNRPFEPRFASTQDMADLQRTASWLPSGGEPLWIQAGELLSFGETDYRWVALPGQSLTRVLYVSNVDGACYPIDAPALTESPVPPQCDVFGEHPVANDIVFRDEFEQESPGTLKIAVEVTPGYAGATTSYVYTVWSEGGPVYDIQLREQFPFYEDSEVQPVYRKSMRLMHPWVCSAMGEAHCGDRGRDQAGLGYLATNNGRLAEPAVVNGDFNPEGSCLRIEVQGRAVRHDGHHDNMAFSNSLHVSARYTSWARDPFDENVIYRYPNRFTYQRQLFTDPPAN